MPTQYLIFIVLEGRKRLGVFHDYDEARHLATYRGRKIKIIHVFSKESLEVEVKNKLTDIEADLYRNHFC